MQWPYDPKEHTARIMCGDPVALAYEWIKAYAESLSGPPDDYYGDQTITAEELITTALENVNSTSRWGSEYISKGGLLEGVSTDPLFWDKLAIFTGRDIPEEKRESFFSCAC